MNIFEVILIIVTIIIIFTLKWFKKNTHSLPGPFNLPFLGYLPWMDPKSPYHSLMKLSNKYGPIYELKLGSIYAVVISDVKILKKIFFKDSASGRAPLHLFDSIFQNRGLIFTQGDIWKNQRRFIFNFLRSLGANNVSLNKNKMENAIINSVSELIQNIKENGDGIALNPAEDIVHNVGFVISSIVLGKNWSRDDEKWKTLLHLMEEGSKLVGVAAPLNFLPWLSVLPTFKKNTQFLAESVLTTHNAYREIIEEKQTCTNTNSCDINLIEAFLAEKTKQETTNYFTDDQFLFLLSDIFGAGLETTVNSLLWFILFVAKHQQVQAKIRQELHEVLQGNPPTLDDMATLPYTEAAIAEASRIRTVLPLGVPHGALQDLQVGEYTIRKGAMVVPLMWAIHMDPKEWSDPDTFRPERFIDAEGKFFRPEPFIPFQIGNRMCVGKDLAGMVLFLFGASILQKFKVELVGKVDLDGICGLTLAPKPFKIVCTAL